MNTCVAWLLLCTYAVLLVIGGCGVWLTADNFGGFPSYPPLPPETTAVTPNSSNDDQSMEQYDVYSDRRSKAPDGYEEYLRNNHFYTDYTKDPRLYLVIPCGASVGIAGVLLMAGIFSRKIFTTTVALYSSLGLWILTFLTSVMYQNIPWEPNPLFYSSYAWMLSFQVVMLILLTLQVGLAMWELRRQKSDWPVINITNVFTFNTVLVVTKMTLAIYATIFWLESPMLRGLEESSHVPSYRGIWDHPRIRSPAYYVLPCTVACAYGLIVSGEGCLSHFFGQMHNRLVACTALISAVCYCGFGVVASPAFVKAVLGNYRTYMEVMIFASLMSILNAVHAFTALILPNALKTPPKFVMVIANSLSSEYSSLQDSNMIEGIRENIWLSYRAASNATMITKFPGDIVSSVVSLVAFILISTNLYYPNNWGAFVMLYGDVAVFTRNMPAAVALLFNRKLTPVPLWQITFSSLIENIALFIGAVGTFCNGWPSGAIVAGVLNILYVLFQSMWLKKNCCHLIKTAIIKTEGSEDTQPIVETEPENTQVLSDEDQSCDPHSLA